MTTDEIARFRELAERDPPAKRVRELWLAIGRRAGKDSIAQAAADRLLGPFRPGMNRFLPMPRRTMLARLARDWRKLPAGICRRRLLINEEPGHLKIGEIVAGPFCLVLPGWDEGEGELALSLSLRVIEAAPPAYDEKNLLLTIVGLHALARRYQRGADRSDAAVLRDLPLGRGWVAQARGGGEFTVPAPQGGKWVGSVMQTVDARRALVLRTYLDD